LQLERYKLKVFPLKLKEVNDTVVNKLAVKDFMFKRRKLWYKGKRSLIEFIFFINISFLTKCSNLVYKTIYEPIMMQQGKIERKELFDNPREDGMNKILILLLIVNFTLGEFTIIDIFCIFGIFYNS